MKLKIIIPEKLNEVSLLQYQQFLKIKEDDPLRVEKIVSIFCKLDIDTIRKTQKSEVQEIFNQIILLLKEESERTPIFKMNGVEYGFIPKLDEMSWGEYIDLDTSISDWENIHKAMAVLYRPVSQKIKSKYRITDYEPDEQVFEEMKQMPLDVVFGALVFFYRLSNELMNVIPNYLAEEFKATGLTRSLNSNLNGDGMLQYIALLTENFYSLIQSPKKEYMNA